MQITKEMLEEKREELLNKREELLAQANVVNGALENILYWLSVLEIKEEPSFMTSPQISSKKEEEKEKEEPVYVLHAVAGSDVLRAEPVSN
jgi:hypothetical protein